MNNLRELTKLKGLKMLNKGALRKHTHTEFLEIDNTIMKIYF